MTTDPWTGDLDGLVGRNEDLLRMRTLMQEGSRTVVVVGIPGAGKSSLLTVAAQEASLDGWQVLRLHGRITEQNLGFASLLDLISTPRDQTPETIAAADAVRVQISPEDNQTSPPVAALRLRLNVKAWLEGLSRTGPVLVVVDDAQWVDPSSRSVLSFVANRAGGTAVSLVFSWRGDSVPNELAAQPIVAVKPLKLAQAIDLLRRSHPALDPLVRNSVIQRAAGNPLALLELARAATAAGPGDRGLFMPATVKAAFAAELPGLSERTRHVLLLAAAGADDLVLLGRLLGTRRLAQDLESAERQGLIRTKDQVIRFRHPLVRSTVYDSASTSERLAVHGLLAQAYDDEDRRTWHRAAATLAPDEDLAAALTESARSARRRGAHTEAAQGMLRAAELSPSKQTRELRLLEAISFTGPTDHVGQLALLADTLRNETDDPLIRATAGHHHAFALAQSMRQSAAQEALERSLAELLDLDVETGWASLTTLASLVYQTGQNVDRAQSWLDRYEQRAPLPRPPYDRLTRAAQGWVRVALAPASRPGDLVSLVRDTPSGDAILPPEMVASEEMLLGATAWLLDEHDVALRRLNKATDLMRRSIGAGHLIQTVMALGQVQFDIGLYAEADGSGELMIDIAEAETLPYHRAVGRELRARVAAVRGDTEWAHRTATDVLRDLDVGECVALEANLMVTLFYARFSVRDYAGGFEQLRSLFDRDGAAIHPHVSYRALGDLASVAVRAGEIDAVRPIVEQAERHLGDSPGTRQSMILCRAKALVSETDAETLYERSIRDPSATRWSLEWANAHLDYGLWLRRHHQTAAARRRLRTAHGLFSRLGAHAWAAVAETELRAAGVVTADSATAGWTGLTAQEREVVELAAGGMSNREIGAALFVSPRTVGAHLYRAFPKLGVTARSQLRDAIERHTG